MLTLCLPFDARSLLLHNTPQLPTALPALQWFTAKTFHYSLMEVLPARGSDAYTVYIIVRLVSRLY